MFYEKIAHEGGEHTHDIVRFSKPGSSVYTVGDCVRRVVKDGKVRVDETRTLRAVGTTVDMLSSFYLMRTLPYQDWQPGHTLTVNIFSGKQQELLTIKYLGKTSLDIDGVHCPTYHISFIFTSDGQKKTSDDMEAWISAQPARIPLKLEGKLPVGKVHCLYTGKI